jgi:hypothetical protein
MPPPASTLKLAPVVRRPEENKSKGKGKEIVKVVEILDSDEEAEEEVKPSKKAKSKLLSCYFCLQLTCLATAGSANDMWTDLYLPETVVSSL